jgi:NAD+ synthase (glutamine-hydrolysing)
LPRIRLAAAALNQTPLAWDANCRNIRAALAAARQFEVGILCLPELCISGYGCEDMFFSIGVQTTSQEVLTELVPETLGIVVCLGLPIAYEGAIYNTSAVCCDGRLLGFVAKQHLAGDGIHYEPRWFRKWPAGKVAAIEVFGTKYPIGDLLFDCGGVRVGLEICRDAWVSDRTGIRLAERGVDVILNPSASHFAFAKQHVRERFVLEGSREFGVSYAYANLLGNEAGRAIYDGGTLLASNGEMLIRGPRFSFADWLLATAVVDVAATRKNGAGRAAGKDGAGTRAAGPGAGHPHRIVTFDFQLPIAQEKNGELPVICGVVGDISDENRSFAHRVSGHPAWENGPHLKEEEFTRAVALALFDYLRKSETQGFVVSLSGGADSSAVGTLVWCMVQLGARELGDGNLKRRLPRVANLRGGPTATGESAEEVRRWIVGQLLTCVYQATRNSSSATLEAARVVAEGIGAEFFNWSVDAIVDRYVETVAAAIDRPLVWPRDDIPLQNIQARARGPGAWLLANLRGALLLTTSNRSEAAVGYATMDGDTCGGLAPIAGIDKAFLLDWLLWMESIGPAAIGPLPALAIVNQQRPTAELRPPEARQTDEGDLMPYRVLDAIERAAIRDKQMPLEVLDSIRPQFSEISAAQLGEWVERFFRLWCRNQWKRERYAPSFHVDDENLDPKTWCRFPILNSGFEREIGQLRAEIARRKNNGDIKS